jgi:hypothetical protein
MPGHGQSDKPDKDEAYGIQIVEDVVLLHRQETISRRNCQLGEEEQQIGCLRLNLSRQTIVAHVERKTNVIIIE